MGLIIKNEGGGAPIEPGAWAAVCSGYIQLGTHTSSFGGEEARRAPRIMITWFMPDQRRDINRRYGLTMHPKGSLRPAIEAMVGKLTPEMEAEFDLDHILGRPCLLEVKQKVKPDGKTFAEIANVGTLPRGMPRPAPVETRTYVMHDEAGGFILPPEWIPQWIVNIIKESEEYLAATGAAGDGNEPSKVEVPF
jgi:hypothetical protein